METGTCLHILEGHPSSVHSVSVTAYGRWCVCASDDRPLHILGHGNRNMLRHPRRAFWPGHFRIGDGRWAVECRCSSWRLPADSGHGNRTLSQDTTALARADSVQCRPLRRLHHASCLCRGSPAKWRPGFARSQRISCEMKFPTFPPPMRLTSLQSKMQTGLPILGWPVCSSYASFIPTPMAQGSYAAASRASWGTSMLSTLSIP